MVPAFQNILYPQLSLLFISDFGFIIIPIGFIFFVFALFFASVALEIACSFTNFSAPSFWPKIFTIIAHSICFISISITIHLTIEPLNLHYSDPSLHFMIVNFPAFVLSLVLLTVILRFLFADHIFRTAIPALLYMLIWAAVILPFRLF